MIPNKHKTSYRVLRPKKIVWSFDQVELYKEIFSFVNKMDNFRSPKPYLEQYSLPSDLIAFILMLISNDLFEKDVIDLGCGTGRFTLPILKFFAKRVLGIDIDIEVLFELTNLCKKNDLLVDLLCTSIEFAETFNWGNIFQVTFMNPPFGTKRRNIDVVFLSKALKYSQTVITMHKSNSSTQRLIKHLGKKHNKKSTILATINFTLPPSLWFHYKKEHIVCIDLFRLSE